MRYQFGTVHMYLGRPIEAFNSGGSDKSAVQKLAFKCFRRVGENLMVTPSSLLSMALLDEPAGALMWSDLLAKAKGVCRYCEKFDIPYVEGLKGERLEPTLRRTLDIFVGNGKLDVIGKHHRSNVYYAIRDECRSELLYLKNTILHHFLIPSIINLAWVNLLRGEIRGVDGLKQFFLYQRRLFKHEFYLPTVRQFFHLTLNIISDAVGRRVGSLQGMAELSHEDIYALIGKVGVFGRSLSYVIEAYYLAALTLRSLREESAEDGITMETYRKKLRAIFEDEVGGGRIVKYPESYSSELVRSSMDFFRLQKIVIYGERGRFRVDGGEALDKLIQRYEKDLKDLVTFNIRVQ